ncbi:C40 family peptidase [Arcicella sp. LKC2W]|uniref:C40 family peptidase n=1 Tax=Arcicella sp. LKC2W TaxID=2984198 RepID=UPI002B1EC081|nr:C40 family peptidase [Arcicella sp. LKC2W]MEA5461932.1 C40 family peptidase [Arcicella sp. LKC2W]
MKKYILVCLTIASFALLGAGPTTPRKASPKRIKADSSITQIIESFALRFAPDKRTAIFQIDAFRQNNHVILSGRTNLYGAKSFLLDRLKTERIPIVDEIKTLPEPELEDKVYGLVEVSVCNIRYSPRHAGELASQALMGTPVRILEKEDNGWLLIQTPDQYISWVDRGAITMINKDKMEQWKVTPKIIYTRAYGSAYAEPNEESATVSDLVAGCIMELVEEDNDFYKVTFPDQRKGYVAKREANNYNNWFGKINATEDNLVTTSKRLMGVPYLWGGTSFKGVDCSGFTKTVYFLNGIILPRDASQQVMIGETIDKTGNWSELKAGDLLYFGEKREDGSERIVHVAMWLGNGEFIHASDKVRVSSMITTAPNFDEYNAKRYLRTKRILKTGMAGVATLKENIVY